MLEKLKEIIDDCKCKEWMTEESRMHFCNIIESTNDVKTTVKERLPKPFQCQYCKWAQCDGTFEKSRR